MRNFLAILILSLLFFSFLSCACHAEDPWGKDAGLEHRPFKRAFCTEKRSSILSAWGQRCIRFHQKVISHADGPRSNYAPSSSQYTKEAMFRYGFFKGFLLGCDRLMRENTDAWLYPRRLARGSKCVEVKYDPVPCL